MYVRLRAAICGAAMTCCCAPAMAQSGIASIYAYAGEKTASGEKAHPGGLTAAHRTLPFGTKVRVTNKRNGRSVTVRINDRGPYVHDRLIDLSRATARYLGFESKGLARVRVRYAGPAPLSGDDRAEQRFLASQPWFRVALARGPNDSR